MPPFAIPVEIGSVGWKAGHPRTQAGLAAARRAGRPPKLTEEDIETAKAMVANPDIGVTQIAHRLGDSRSTHYRTKPTASVFTLSRERTGDFAPGLQR
jgi:DNA invertase Pin-like site-specific DNA recombinase